MSSDAIAVIITSSRVRAYSNGKTAARVYQRAKRLGVKGLELVTAPIRKGDRYKHVEIAGASWPRCCCEIAGQS